MRTFQQILEAAGYETSAYSGRGMGGGECVSVASDDARLGSLFVDVVEASDAEDMECVAKAFRRMRMDSLGRGIVVYFPGIAHE